MRKVMGASKQQVFMQFMGESTLVTFIAAVLAFMLGILLILISTVLQASNLPVLYYCNHGPLLH
jgi:ABC-type antimicrobial peptide transport system permease subunit